MTRQQIPASSQNSDPYDLERFVQAQELEFEDVLSELREGKKRSHWMWFIFPQIKGLGQSNLATKFAISSKNEAEAYLNHRVLGPRLEECTRLVLLVEGHKIEDIFGYLDDLKFRSSMTLFSQVVPEGGVFLKAIE